MSRVESTLQRLGITLPEAPKPVAAYVPVRLGAGVASVSGQIPMQDGVLLACGPVPSSVSPEDARTAARCCAINAMAALREALDGDLDRITGVLRVGVFVASDPGFHGQPAVADAVSTLLVEVFGDAGRHARAAVGSIALPLGATVEVEMLVELGP
ncbi:MAG: RidA family protein [Phycisphaerales bacterium]|nr:RidA family protein [Phycisphaerales bacterium]